MKPTKNVRIKSMWALVAPRRGAWIETLHAWLD